MAVEHSAITGANIHEPKGIDAPAAVNTVYVANGSGSGVWRRTSQGSTHFEASPMSSPYTLAYPATYTKLAPTTVASGSPYNVTEATTSRLTYTGTATLPCNVFANVSLDQTSGSSKDVRIAVYKNGTTKITGSVTITTTSSGVKQTLSIQADVTMATNDYVEIWAQNDGVSGGINIYTLQLMLESMTD